MPACHLLPHYETVNSIACCHMLLLVSGITGKRGLSGWGVVVWDNTLGGGIIEVRNSCIVNC